MEIFVSAKDILSPNIKIVLAQLLPNSDEKKRPSELGNHHFTWSLVLSLICAHAKLCRSYTCGVLGICWDSETSQG